MDILNIYTYKLGESSFSIMSILLLIIEIGLVFFAVYVGIRVVKACNIYIALHKDQKDK